jgi:hypothetical protein
MLLCPYIALKNDATNGITVKDYVVVNGQKQYINTIIMVAYARIFTPLGSYPFDPTFGSLIPSMMAKGSGTRVTAQSIVTAVNNALQPMINSNLIKTATCQITPDSAIINNFTVNFAVILVDYNNISYTLPVDYTRGA